MDTTDPKYSTAWLEGIDGQTIEDRVVAAYRAEGLKAKARSFFDYDGSCCALSALFGRTSPGKATLEDWMTKAGTTEQALWQFIWAFDARLVGERAVPAGVDLNTPEAQAGIRVADRVKAEGLSIYG